MVFLSSKVFVFHAKNNFFIKDNTITILHRGIACTDISLDFLFCEIVHLDESKCKYFYKYSLNLIYVIELKNHPHISFILYIFFKKKHHNREVNYLIYLLLNFKINL
jgi:hypothetical protein